MLRAAALPAELYRSLPHPGAGLEPVQVIGFTPLPAAGST